MWRGTSAPWPLVLLLVLCAFAVWAEGTAKICWEGCTEESPVLAANIDGCRRRRPRQPGVEPKFRCEGTKGPPCVVKRGDVVNLFINFYSDTNLQSLTQHAYWEQGWIDIPWAGMDNDACKYLGSNCTMEQNIDNHELNYPITISEYYPTGKYPLKWILSDGIDDKKRIGCFRFVIKIV